jgi:signal transduction histidine kinase
LGVNWRLAQRVPFGLRAFFRGTFLLLALATLALAVNVLQDEKQRAHRTYEDGLKKNQAQIAARLRHPTGQLALLNPGLLERAATPLRPLLLPFSAIDFDDRYKAQQAVEMAGCLVQYADSSSMCVGVGSNPYVGGFIYVVGSFAEGGLTPHVPGDLDLEASHRVRITVAMRGQTYAWIAPFEAAGEAGTRGRLTGFVEGPPITPSTRPVRDFRGWLWQDGRCLATTADPSDLACPKRTFLSVRLPIELFQEALRQRPLIWPPADLEQIVVHVKALPPGDGAPLFDSDREGATLPFSIADLKPLLLAGETLRVHRLDAATGQRGPELIRLSGAADASDLTSPWLDALIRRLPVEGYDAPIEARELIATALGRYELVLTGDVRSVNRGLAAVATRVSGFVGAMLLAVILTWLAIELRIIRRITLLTKRAATVSTGVRAADGLAAIDLSDLRGRDELGVLAQGLQDLLRRVNEDLKRDQIRAEQEKDMWHAVGHEIMSPLQSLMALHGGEDDPSQRYISRMQQAIRVLYGHASPSEAFETTTLQVQPIDLDAFLATVAGNAAYSGIHDVVYQSAGHTVLVRADEFPLEDVVTHVLRNADRHRTAGTPIAIRLDAPDTEVCVTLHNTGPGIPDSLIDKIFEYGVSDAGGNGGDGQRGQGLFVAKTYMAKMGGTISAHNVEGGVEFRLRLQRVVEGRVFKAR